MSMERRRNIRRTHDARSCSFVVGNVPNLNERLDSNSELNDLVKFLVGNIKVKSSHGGLFSFLRRKK